MNRERRMRLALLVCISYIPWCTAADIPAVAAFQLPPGSKVALATGRFDPALSLDAKIRGQADGGASGAVRGAAACLQGAGSGGGWVGGLVVLACLPFGFTFGAIAGTHGSAPEASIASAEQQIAAASKTLDLQRRFIGGVQQYAKERGIDGLVQLADEGPQSAEDTPRYQAGPEYVVEIVVTEVRAATPGSAKLPYGFTVHTRVRIVQVRDNSVVDSFSGGRGIAARTIGEWTAENGKLLEEQFRIALRQIAEDIVDEVFPLYREEAGTTTGAGKAERPTPAYVLRPVQSLDFTVRTMRSAAEGGFGPLLPEKVDSATPLLAWEKLPRSIPAELFSGSSPRAQNLVYDVRVFGAGRIRDYSSLKDPELRIEEALEPCRYYRWTVRARFELDGIPRATEWSGAYFAVFLHGDSVIDPSWARRRQWPSSIWIPRWPNFAYYFPLLTPSADGKRCAEPR